MLGYEEKMVVTVKSKVLQQYGSTKGLTGIIESRPKRA